MNRARLFVLLACLSSLSCTSSKHGPFETKMIQTIAACKDQSQCVLRMSDITSFAWDKMYACKYTAGRQEIEQTIGTKLDQFNELERRVIFMKGSNIVFHEAEELTDVEKPVLDEITFDIPDNANCRSYDHNVRFSVKQVSLEDNLHYYELTQIR